MLRPYKRNQAADSERKTRWKRGPVNSTPTSFSPRESASQTWTTRPWVAKSASLFLTAEKRFPFAEPAWRSRWARREPYCVRGMRISRSEPMATSKRVTKAAPLRQRFSLEVSSSKAKPCASRPRTFSGRRTALLPSERCLDTVVLASGTIGWLLDSCDSDRVGANDSRRSHWIGADPSPRPNRPALRKALDPLETLP